MADVMVEMSLMTHTVSLRKIGFALTLSLLASVSVSAECPQEWSSPTARRASTNCDVCPCTAVAVPRYTSRERASIRNRSRDLTQILRETNYNTARIVQHERQKWTADKDPSIPWTSADRERYKLEVVAVGPQKDEFGAPMYTVAGPRAYAQSASYSGPPYIASFERPYSQPRTDTEYRGYFNAAQYQPTVVAPAGSYTSPGATQSYMQSGMVLAPASAPSSAARPAINNSW
jgi:hypothetical protein